MMLGIVCWLLARQARNSRRQNLRCRKFRTILWMRLMRRVVGEVDWIPVGAEFIVTEELTADKKSALDTANAQLRQGQTKEALQTLQIVGGSIDLIFGVAPLAPTLGAVNRAAVFAEGRDPKSAMQALTDAINGIVFVSDDYIATVVPLPAGKSAK
jgi:hypothetical protein